MKYALLRQQPLLEVQVASFKHFFKERNTKLLLSEGRGEKPKTKQKAKNKTRGIKGAKCYLKKGECVQNQIHRSVRGQTRFSKVY